MKKIIARNKFLIAIIAFVVLAGSTFFIIRGVSADTYDVNSYIRACVQLLEKKNTSLNTLLTAGARQADIGDLQAQIDSNQRTIDWLNKGLPPVMSKPVSEALADLVTVGIDPKVGIPENGEPIDIRRSDGTIIKVHPVVLNAIIQNNRIIGKVIETNNYLNDYAKPALDSSFYLSTPDSKSKAIVDPYYNMLKDIKATPDDLKSLDEVVAFYKGQADDFSKVGLELISQMNATTDATKYARLNFLYQNNDRNYRDIVARGKRWVVVREAMKSPDKNKIDPDALGEMFVKVPAAVSGKEKTLNENSGNDTAEIYNYVPAQKITKERLDQAAKEFNKVDPPALTNPLAKPTATRTQTELPKSPTAVEEKIAIDEPLTMAVAEAVTQLQTPSLTLAGAFGRYQPGIEKTFKVPADFEGFYKSDNPTVRQTVVKSLLQSLESSGQIDIAGLRAPDPRIVSVYREAGSNKAILSLRPEKLWYPTKINLSGTRIDGTDPASINLRAQVVADDVASTMASRLKVMTAIAEATTPRQAIINPAVQQHLSYSSRSSLSINPSTARAEFTTQIIDPKGTVIGSVGFDPIAQRYNGQLTQTFGGKQVTLFSDARTGYVSASFSNKTGPLLKSGMLEISSLTVAKSGDIGGEFKLANRLFRYNPNSKAFEIPIASIIGDKKTASLSGKGMLGEALSNLSVDTNGTVVGHLNLTSKNATNTGGLFFDSTGNIGATYTFNAKDMVNGKTQLTALASFGVSKDGLSGTVNVGKLAFDKNLFVSFGKGGITGVSVPIGSVGLGFSKDGGLSLSSVIPIGGLPIPISLSADAHGNLGIGIPFVGNLITFGHENRDLNTPALKPDETGKSIDMQCLFVKRTIRKGLFGTTKVTIWNTQPGSPCPIKASPEEQKLRAKMIFDKYREILKRNPTQEEFVDWYFYAGGNIFNMTGYDFIYNSDSTYRTMQTKALLTSSLKSPSYSATCGKGVKSKCNDPANAMPYSPFDEKEVATYQSKLKALPENQTTQPGTTSMKDFFDAINKAAANDPYFQNGTYNIPGVTATSQDTITVTADGTVTVTAQAGSATGNSADEAISTNDGRTYTDPNETDAGVSEEEEQNAEEELVKGNTAVFSPGFNVYTVDPVDQTISAKPFVDAGLGIFEFNTDGSGKWKSNQLKDDIQVLRAGVGYYIYNPTKNDISIEKSSAYSDLMKGVNKGWNLLANSSDQSVTLSQISVDAIKAGSTCKTSDCYETKTIASLVAEGRTKGKLMKVVSGETDPAKAFTVVDLSANAGAVTIEANTIFWLYLAK